MAFTDSNIWDIPVHLQYVKDAYSNGFAAKAGTEKYFTGSLAPFSTEQISAQEDDQRLAKAVQDISPDLVKMDDHQYNTFRDTLSREIANVPQVPGQAKLQSPTLAQALLTAFAMTSNPQQASEIAGAPMRYGLEKQQQDTQDAMMRYQADMKARQDRIDHLRELMGMQNQRDIQNQKSRLDLADSNRDAAIQQRGQDIQSQGRMDALQQRNEAAAWEAYNKAPNETNARRLRALVGDLAPTPEDVARDANAFAAKQQLDALKTWDEIWRKNADLTGIVNESDLPYLQKQKQAIADLFHVSPDTLTEPRTLQTMTKQIAGQKKEEFNQKLHFAETEWRGKMAIQHANTEIARARAEAYMQQVQHAATIADQTLALNRAKFEWKKYSDGVKTQNSGYSKQDRDLEKVERGKKEAYNNATDPKVKAKLGLELDQIRGERQWLKEQIDPIGAQIDQTLIGGNPLGMGTALTVNPNNVVDVTKQAAQDPSGVASFPFSAKDTQPVSQRLASPPKGPTKKERVKAKSQAVKPVVPNGWQMEGF